MPSIRGLRGVRAENFEDAVAWRKKMEQEVYGDLEGEINGQKDFY